MILVAGSADQEHAAYVFEKIQALGQEVAYCNTQLFPHEMGIAFNAESPCQGYIRLASLPEAIPLEAIRSVYWRMGLEYADPEQLPIQDPYVRQQVFRDIMSALGSFFNSLNCLCVDPLAAFEKQFYKPFQLQQFQAAGIPVPDSLVTNDREAVYAFFEKHQGQVVYKPCTAFAQARKLEADELHSDRFDNLWVSPVNFQQLIPGTDILAYVIGNEVFSATVHTKELDFRMDWEAKLTPVELPEAIQEHCLKMAQIMGSHFLLVDLRKTPDGTYYFFDGTPSPKFMDFERDTGLPVSDRLIAMLINGKTQ